MNIFADTFESFQTIMWHSNEQMPKQPISATHFKIFNLKKNNNHKTKNMGGEFFPGFLDWVQSKHH